MWQSWDTVQVRDPIAYWSEVVFKGVLDASLRVTNRTAFSGKLSSRNVGSARLVSFNSSAHRIDRNKRQIGRSDEGHYMIGLQCRGVCNIGQNQNEVSIRPGEIGIVHAGYPFELEFPATTTRRLVLLPRSVLDRHLDSRAMANGRPLRISNGSAAARIAREAIVQITDASMNWAVRDAEIALDALARLLAGIVGDVGKSSAAETGRRKGVRPSSSDIVSAIKLRATEPDISPEKVADQFCMSPRTLYRILAERDLSFRRILIEERLEIARRVLSSSEGVRETLTSLALHLGFQDSAHFSRSYRARFGEAPKETRSRTAASLN